MTSHGSTIYYDSMIIDFRPRSRKKMTLVGVFSNRNWILGNWLKEVLQRSPSNFQISWTPFIYSGKRKLEKIVPSLIQKGSSYFFSYPTLFEYHLKRNSSEYLNRSIVLYPHSEPEMGSLEHQVQILNQAFCTYFFCSADANALIQRGLDRTKTKIAYCAVDVDCVPSENSTRDSSTIVMASKFGPRKGLQLLPQLVAQMPNYNFIALGRGWEDFIEKSNLKNLKNFRYIEFNKSTRNEYFSKATYFLSVSLLEGGPVPLIEAMALGCIPIATKTGFAPDLIANGENGILLSVNPSVEDVKEGIKAAHSLSGKALEIPLTWDRITSMMITDKRLIESFPRIRS